MTPFYEDAIPGYNVQVDENGLFRCGCGKDHVFAQTYSNHYVDSNRYRNAYVAWYMECAFQYLLTVFDMV